MKLILPFGPALILLSLQGVAGAQTLEMPLVEIGGQIGLVGGIAEGVHVRPIAGPRLTLNISPQDAVEMAFETLFPNGGSGLYGLYFVQYKRTTRHPPDWRGIRPFFTAGTGGYYSYRKVSEHRVPRLDGSVVVFPAHARGELSHLSTVAFGGGFESGLNRHASFRLEGSGFVAIHSEGFLGFRVLAGISVPIGGYRVRPVR